MIGEKSRNRSWPWLLVGVVVVVVVIGALFRYCIVHTLLNDEIRRYAAAEGIVNAPYNVQAQRRSLESTTYEVVFESSPRHTLLIEIGHFSVIGIERMIDE